jgi:translation initiation factor 2 gamma subunit (eIF-2gamma)
VAASEQKFIDSMVGDIKKNVEAVRLLINEFNEEYDLLKEVLTKSISEKIREVREEERMKAAL